MYYIAWVIALFGVWAYLICISLCYSGKKVGCQRYCL